MSRIEELPDDFDERLDLNALTAGHSVAELEESYARRFNKPPPTGQEKPAPHDRSFEEVMSEISKTPLFMNSDDVNGAVDADGGNTALEAIRAMQYEGTKAEIAQGFKEQGNEMVKMKKWSDAKEFYTKGIAVLTARDANDKWEKGEDPEEESKKQKALEEQIYVNRALCNLELRNFRSTTLDSASALRLNPSNVKAYYRSASALLALDKLLEASDACHRGLQLEPANSALKTLSTQISNRQKRMKALAAAATAERERKAKEAFTLHTALSARGIFLKWSEKPPDLEDSAIHLSPDPLSPKSMLEFPVLLLYPMHGQSDMIKAFAEKDKLVHHLSYILPLPWDTKKEYKLTGTDAVECYMDTPKGGMIKVGKKLSLLQVLANGKTVVMDALVKIHVVPAKLAGKWIEEIKRRKGA